MSRQGNPWVTPRRANHSWETLKYEEVQRNEYRDLGESTQRNRPRFGEVYTENGFTPLRLPCRRPSSKTGSSGCRSAGHETTVRFFRHDGCRPSVSVQKLDEVPLAPGSAPDPDSKDAAEVLRLLIVRRVRRLFAQRLLACSARLRFNAHRPS